MRNLVAGPARYTILMTRKLVLLSLLMAGFAFGQNRIFELRTYTCNEGKLEALKTRFRDHTIEIFKRHGMESIGYWIPQDPEKSKTTLIYIISHAGREKLAGVRGRSRMEKGCGGVRGQRQDPGQAA